MGGEGDNRGRGCFRIWSVRLTGEIGILCNERLLLLKVDQVVREDAAHGVDRSGFKIAKFLNYVGALFGPSATDLAFSF